MGIGVVTMIRASLLRLLCAVSLSSHVLAAPEVVLLWPEGAPGAVGDTERDCPSLTIYRAPAKTANGAAVVICPGGGYGGLAMDHEGHEIARWLNSFGVTGAILRYRHAPRYRHPAPMQDVQRAIRHVRSRSVELGVDPGRVGVLGFSAGGHLAATAATLFREGKPAAEDPVERLSSRPDFAVLCYPVIDLRGPHAHRGSARNLLGADATGERLDEMSLQRRVTKGTPPTFLFHTNADRGVPPENSVLFYQALRQAGVPAELHIYRDGPHGVGLDRHAAIRSWPDQARLWMKHLGVLEKRSGTSWIWLGSEAGERQVVYFRRRIEIDDRIASASLAASCDNHMTVFVNGKRVLTSGQWEEPVRADLKGKLRQGTNIVAVRARNDGGPAGLVVRIEVRTAGGETVVVSTDRLWWASSERQEGWTSVDFEPEAWGPATELARLGEGPWAERVTLATLEKAAVSSPSLATLAEHLTVLPGFRAELLYSVPKEEKGSWVSLAVDPKGRLITSDQYGSLYRITPPEPGQALDPSAIEEIELDIGGAPGLLYAFDSLYVVRGEGRQGLYRVRDTDGDDQFDEIELLRRLRGGGEHGPHSVILSPDGESLYVCGGNHTDIPDPEKSVVPRVWQEDLLLPRMWDAGGHAHGKLAPGGWIARTDPDGKTWELVVIGFRNEFDIAFSAEGELFTFDADMEWDIGTPWYRPTRVNHGVSGADFGWRSGTGKWPEYYPDSLGSVVDIGPGSPTGIAFGTGARFPEKYQRALYIGEWSYGKLYAVHLEPDGATWKGTAEQFIAGSPLPVTDLVVNPRDGALYVIIGGRRTQSGLYRITHESSPPARKLEPRVTPEARIRRRLEAFHSRPDARAVDAAWKYLGHPDRALRHAARLAIEHRPVAEWSERALAEKEPQAAILALIALARHGTADVKDRLLEALGRIDRAKLDPSLRLSLLRAYGLAFVRLGRPDEATAREIAGRLNRQYPAPSYELNRELSQLLIHLEAGDVVEKTLALLARAPTQEEQIHYALALRSLEKGWTLEQRRTYFAWFHGAQDFHGGHSFRGFLRNIKNEARARLGDEEKRALADVLRERPAGEVLAELPRPKGPGKEWKIDDVLRLVGNGLEGRDFHNGKNMFAAASCFRCHRFAGEGAAAAPDLTGLSGRFNVRDLLESLTEPDKVISDQYQATVFVMKDGSAHVGRIVNMSGDNLSVNTDMMDPNRIRGLDRRNILSMHPSRTSLMPAGLLDPLNGDEVLDLLAYLLSRGDPGNRMFLK